MIVEVLSKFGGAPIRLEASQVVIRNDTGTAVSVAGEFGPTGTIKAAHVLDEDFNRVLRAFGYESVNVAVVDSGGRVAPAGARLIRP